MSSDIPTAHLVDPPESRISRWLDWWCSSRWRTLLSWIALNGVLVGLVTLEFFDGLVDAVDVVAQFISRVFYLHPVVRDVWQCVAVSVVICGFQPVLLRLTGLRAIVWITAFVAGICTNFFLETRSGSAGRALIVLPFPLPGLALIGYRTRPWMPLIGGLVIIAPAFVFSSTDYGTALRFIAGGVFLAGVLYPAFVIFGTELKVQNRAQDAAPAGTSS